MAMYYTVLVYETIKYFPKTEQYALSDQRRQSLTSIALGSVGETRTALEIAFRLKCLDDSTHTELDVKLEEVNNMLFRLLKSKSDQMKSEKKST